MNELKYLIIHCTATPEGREVTSDQIRAWHLSPPPNGRGWNQVGYADLIHLNGTIENLVEYNEDNWVQSGEITNGAGNYNFVSRHIVYAGGMNKAYTEPKDTLTEKQFESLVGYVQEFIKNHPKCKVIGHNQVANKACPSFSVNDKFRGLIPDDNLIL